MVRSRAGSRFCGALLASIALALAITAAASAHAQLSPPIVQAKESQIFTLAVPTEKENTVTTSVEFTPPSGFSIDSFVPSPGWKRKVRSTGSGEGAVVQKVTWTGGRVPTGEDASFQFLAAADKAKSYTFRVRQIYSDGSIVDWSGPEASDSPAPVVQARSSLAGGSNSTLALIALIVGALGIVIGVVSLLVRPGGRALA